MKKTVLFFAVSLIVQCVSAQNATIFGSVKDSISGTGVAFSHVIILNESDNIQVNFGITDEKGNYRIDGLNYGNYTIKVSCLGYKTKTVSGITLTPEQRRINVNILIDIDITVLDEAVIVANRPTIEFRPDKQILHIDEAAAAGATVADLLMAVPEISVAGDQVILKTFAPTILVNGKPASGAMSDLTNLPASLFSSIEIITNPSVRYNPEGLGGIINLKTRRAMEGINGMIQGSAGTNNRYNGIGTLNYRTKKWNVFANVWDRYEGVEETGSLYQEFENGQSINQTHEFEPKLNRISMRVGTDFEPDSMNVFTIYWEFSKRAGEVNNINKWEVNELLTTNSYSNYQFFDLDARQNQIAMNYIRTFKNNGELDVDVTQRLWYEPYLANLTFNDTETYDDKLVYDMKKSMININYSSLIFDTWALTAGTNFDFELTEVDNDMTSNVTTEYHHTFDMERLINAYYFSLAKSLGKLNFVAGLRGEYVNQKLNSEDFQGNDDYFSVYPNLGIMYSINEKINLTTMYGRRVARPGVLDLIPYSIINYSYPYERIIGNPNLKPAYTNSFDFGGSISDKNYALRTAAAYMRTGNDIADVYYSEDGINYTTKKNIATTQKILFYSNIDYWGIGMYRPIFTTTFGWEIYDTPDQNGKNIHKNFFNYNLSLNNCFYFGTLYIFFVTTYHPRAYMYASTTEAMTDLRLTVRKVFQNGLSVQAAYFNMLDANPVINTYGDDFTSQKNINQNTKAIYFGLMYKFGKPIKTRAKVDLNLNRIETQ